MISYVDRTVRLAGSRPLASLLAFLGASSALSFPALAQEADDTLNVLGQEEASPAAPKSEIVVIARRRGVNSAQEVAAAVESVSGLELSERLIIDSLSLSSELPSLNVAQGPFQPSVSIRGVGSGAGNRYYEQSVPFFIDGVFAGRAQQFSTPFFDLQAIEVVKGPQALFFGKNATAGAVSIQSAEPTFVAEYSGNIAYEAVNEGYLAETAISGPLSEKLAGRLAVRIGREGGYLTDLSNDNEAVPEVDTFGIRGSLLYEVSSNFSVLAKAEYTEREQKGRSEQAYCANTAFTTFTDPFFGGTIECVEDTNTSSGTLSGPPGSAPLPPIFDSAQAQGDDGRNNESFLGLVRMNLETGGGFEIVSTTSFSSFDTSDIASPDFSSLPIVLSEQEESFEQFSQEILLSSPTGGTFEFSGGLLFLSQKHEVPTGFTQIVPPDPNLPDTAFPQGTPNFAALGVPAVFGDAFISNLDTKAYSAFGQITWNITDELSVSAGARLTHDEKDLVVDSFRFVEPVILPPATPGGPPQINPNIANATIVAFDDANLAQANGAAQYRLDRSETSLDPAVTIQWQPSRGINVFASFARGTKAGGFEAFPRLFSEFPILNVSELEFEEETATSFEIGLKTDFDVGTTDVRLNVAAFTTDYDDLQVLIFDPNRVAFITDNAEQATVSGFEIDTVIKPSSNFSFGGSLTYLDAKFDEFFVDLLNADLSDNRLASAPEFSGNVFADANFPVGNALEINFRTQASYRDDNFLEEQNDPNDVQDSHWLVDLRVGLGAQDGRWELYANVRNLFDEDDIQIFGNQTALTPATQFVPDGAGGFAPGPNLRASILAPGRTVSIGARFNF